MNCTECSQRKAAVMRQEGYVHHEARMMMDAPDGSKWFKMHQTCLEKEKINLAKAKERYEEHYYTCTYKEN